MKHQLITEVREFLSKNNISQKDFAKYYGIKDPFMSQIMSSKRSFNLEKLGAVLHSTGYRLTITFEPTARVKITPINQGRRPE